MTQVQNVIVMAAEYYVFNPTGGSLHIVLDNGNYERNHVEFCRQYAVDHNDEDGVKLADALLTLTDTEREKMYNDHDYNSACK